MYWVFCVCVLVVLYWVYDWWKRTLWISGLHKRAVLITGCDTGFGKAAAKSLYERGVYVYAACYTESGAHQLQQEVGDRLRTIILDVTKHESVLEAYQYVKDTLPDGVEFWGLVNNAGVLPVPGQLEFISMDVFKHAMNVNFFGTVDMAKTFLPLLKKSRGRLVNTASVASEILGPELIPYYASKWAVKCFSESLRMEKYLWGLKVATIMPTGFRTDLTSVERVVEGLQKQWDDLDSETQNQYGENFINESIVEAMKMLPQYCHPDLTPVIKAYEHALLSVHPYETYRPGGGFMKILKYLPISLLSKYFYKPRVPQVLRNK